jgi:putative peptide maturation dehydrogenase
VAVQLADAAPASAFWQTPIVPASDVKMRLRRPHILHLECRERPQFSLENLLSAGDTSNRSDWVALAPHLEHEVLLEPEDLAVLHAVSPGEGESKVALVSSFGEARIARLVEAGLLLGDHPGHARLRDRDQALRDIDWWPPAAVAHRFGRWRDVDIAAEEQRSGKRTLAKLMADRGAPPVEAAQCRPLATWRPLPPPVRTDLDELLARRSTCRNFDPDAHLPLAELSSVLHRVFGAQASHQMAPGAIALKKNSPSGGGLHPIEAYLLVQRVEGIAPGLYHYQSVSHALEPMQLHAAAALAGMAHELVAGQAWFANAPVHILMAARFQRSFWKYRKHPKAWRVIQLDAGHLSQNLYLSATELGHGAFITGAINDECAERLFELDGIQAGAIAVCGFGPRSGEVRTVEFDPLGKVAR